MLALAFVLAGRLSADQSASLAARPGSLSGQIISAFDGRPLDGVRLTLLGPTLDRPLTAITAAGGEYLMRAVPPGSYTLTASRDSYYTTKYGERRPGELARRIDLGDGESLNRIDLALPPGAGISGRVLDRRGQPDGGALVAAHRRSRDDPMRPLLAGLVRTDSRGNYDISGLPPGTYSVAAESSETWKDDAGGDIFAYQSTESPERLLLDEGMRRRVDISLTVARAARITGRVDETSDTPLSGARVRLLRPESLVDQPSVLTEVAATVTGADGRFDFPRLAPVVGYVLEATLPSGATSRQYADTRNDNLLRPKKPGALSAAMLIQSGRLPFPASRLTVVALRTNGPADSLAFVEWRVAATPGDGLSTWRGLDGEYLFRVEGLPHDWMVTAVRLDDRDLTDAPLAVPEGSVIRDMRIVVSPVTATVAGDVVDPHGAPLADCTVIAFATDRARWGVGTRFVKAIRPDLDGHYAIDGLPSGAYYLAAKEEVRENSWDNLQFLEELAARASRVTLQAGTTERVSLLVDYEK